MFIKLTGLSDNKPIWLNTEKIEGFAKRQPIGITVFIWASDETYSIKESPEEILALIEGKGPPTQPEENPMKYHILYQSEKIASFEYKSTRDICLNYLILEYNDTKYTTPNDE